MITHSSLSWSIQDELTSKKGGITLVDWMSLLDDSTPLNSIMMPGAHDA